MVAEFDFEFSSTLYWGLHFKQWANISGITRQPLLYEVGFASLGCRKCVGVHIYFIYMFKKRITSLLKVILVRDIL